MHYALLLHTPEPAPGEIDEKAISEMETAFGHYLEALRSAGVLKAAEIMEQSHASTTVTLRTGSLQVQDGPFADTKEAMAGVFVIDVPDLDAALGWAEKCPAAGYGVIEVRPVAISGSSGAWSRPDCPQR